MHKAPFKQPAHKLIADYAMRYAHQTPEREAVVFAEQRLTYTKLYDQVIVCARALLAIGIEKGDRVAVLCTSRPEYWVTFLAATSIGAIWLGLNPKYQPQEIRYVIDDAQPRLLFAMAGFEGRTYTELVHSLQADYGCITHTVFITESILNTQSWAEFMALADSIDHDALAQRKRQIDTMDPALLVYTSGSTGKPKGALLSHYGLCFGSEVGSSHLALREPRILCNFPINHVACVADTCCVNLVAGGTIVFQERFDPAQVLQTIERERLTLVGGVPTMLLMLLDHPDFVHTDFSSVELIAWGGAALPVSTIKRLQKLAPRLINVYGMTETAANTTYTSPDADLVELSETIGRPSPYMPCRIVNADAEECAVGEEGELQFKGDYLLLEYLNRPQASREVYTGDGWLHSGDLGYWRDNGTISLVGRLSDMYKSGGYNVYPREIENRLESHPAVAMAAVVAVPDKRYQEVGAAFVMTNQSSQITADGLRDFCKETLANYKVPKTFSLVNELPMLPVGKVDKVSLKQMALEQG